MMEARHPGAALRVLILAPTGRDAALAEAVLAKAGIETWICPDMPSLCRQAAECPGSLLIAEEAITPPQARKALADVLARQPSWSDLAVLVLTEPGADSATAAAAFSSFGNVTLLERPVRVAALVSAARVALRARERQYELRDRFAAKALLAAIVESSDDAMISKTLEGIILTWNRGAERMFGYTAAEAVGRPITMITPYYRHDEERTILERIRRGETVHYETVRMTKDGRRLDISLCVSPIRDAANNVIGASKVARDISIQKRNEQALREADRRKDEFLATLAHELRNPLAPIRSSLELLELVGRSDPTVAHVRGMMERQVNHMVRLVDDLMEVSRITRGKIKLRKEPVDLAEVIRSAIETSEPLIEAAGVHLKLSIAPEPLVLEADRVRLIQVIANLVNNAVKYSEKGSDVCIIARREGREAVVTVRDFGIGIPGDMLARVFDMFMQIENRQRGGQTGLGIGLTLVRGLVQMHGGSVIASSEGVDKGSEFTVRLPMAEGAAPNPTQVESALPAISSQRVLVVDDNHDAADSMGMLLKCLGAEVEVVHDGSAALQIMESFLPTLVLLDLRMPEMDGFEVARRIREQPRFRDVTLIALTGWSQEKDLQRSRDAGFDHHLIKPAGIEALRALMPAVGGTH